MDPITLSYLLAFVGLIGVDLALSREDDDAADDDSPPPPEAPATAPETYVPGDYDETRNGTTGNDSLAAATAADVAWFLGGGDDSLEAGTGNDYAEGGDGDDLMQLRDGDDLALGGSGADTIDAGIGFDRVQGGEGDDSLLGNGGGDTLDGDAGNDTLAGGSGADLLRGGVGDDLLISLSEGLSTAPEAMLGDGADTLDGGEGRDRLVLGPGDTGTGGAGDDIFAIDHLRPDVEGVTQITDFAEGDALEILYAATSEGGAALPVPVVTVEASATGSLVLLDGVPVADVTGGQALTPALIRLIAA